ncbi:M16 family metallopeptidase [Aestuariivirga litoralis]|uniref:M16 family metallopeptidase n=1 Tax=Aestuariivirga litoralis TaxID=2650924 RepID=UPI0018C495CD|nr:pitrilysin family protein [Aestuariivirga litoralis]MBG1233416.1 insulinase family protein [Aestuariivirga litoralis]
MTVEISKLDNGLTVITQTMPHLESVAQGIWVKAGARDEMPQENGVAHFLEHMAFKGTLRRRAKDIAEEIESAGGEINAATGMESTTYYARTLKGDWPLAMDILADIFTASTLDEEELERERDVILQEIAAAKDQPDDLVFELAQSASYGQHPLGRSILGTEELVQNMTREQMLTWRDRNYWASRMVVCAVGNVDHTEFVAAANEHYGKIPRGHMPQRQPPAFGAESLTEQKPLDQTHLVLSFPAPNYRDPRIYQLQVLASILGGGMSSRLFQEVREKRGLCYSVFAFGTTYEDTGQLGVYAATSPDHTPELIDVTAAVMHSMMDEITPKELERAKAQLKTSIVMNLESASSRADQIARQYLAFGEVPDIKKLIARIEAVTVEEVCALASDIFGETIPSMSAVGQLSSLESHTALAARFKRVR